MDTTTIVIPNPGILKIGQFQQQNVKQQQIFDQSSNDINQDSESNDEIKFEQNEECDNVSKSQDDSLVQKKEGAIQTFSTKFIYKNNEGIKFSDPQQSKDDKQKYFLSQYQSIQQVIQNQEQFYLKQLDLNKQLDNSTIRIFKQIKEFSIGTYRYSIQNEKLKKTFIPLFPYLYLKHNIDASLPKKYNDLKNFNIDSVECNFYNKFNSKKFKQNQAEPAQEEEQEQKKFPTHIQLKFGLDNQNFLSGTREHNNLIENLLLKKLEVDRQSESSDYQQNGSQKDKSFSINDKIEIEKEILSKKREFQLNIKLLNSRLNINFAPKIYFEYDTYIDGNLGNFDLVIEQNVPGEFMERKSDREKTFQNTMSPLQYDNDLINYWNLKQVIFVRGQKALDFEPEEFFKALVEQELIQSFENKIPKEYDFDFVRNDYDDSKESESINKQNFEQMYKELNYIKDLGNQFEQKMNQLAMPLRLSIMVLISNQKIQIFDRNIIDLIDYLIKDKKFGVENQQSLQLKQSQEYWNNDQPEKFEYKQFQIGIESLFFRTGVLQFDKPLKQKELINIIEKQIEEIYKTKNSKLEKEIKDQTKNPNKLGQRRIWMTPTLKIIRPIELEQSNPLLRQLKQVIEYFARINIMNDNFQDFFFNNEMQNNLLEQFVEPIIKEINVCGIRFKFLNYSASQIKSKSWWQLIDNHGFLQSEEARNEIENQIRLIKNRETLLEFMGKFNDPKQLKQLARQGQSMSSSIFVCNINSQNIRIIQDVKNKDYAFTDGCGYISQDIMDKVCEIFDLYHASAIQMRFQGFKGVLMVHPQLGKQLPDQNQILHVLFSNGMKKFDGNINQLSVIRCATFSPGFLNRQVILILSHLGVKDELFIEKNSEAIGRLDIKKNLGKLYKIAKKIKNFEKEDFQLSLKQMQEEMSLFFGPSKQFKHIFIRAILMCNKYEQLIEKNGQKQRLGFELDQEPIFEQILLNMVLSQAQILKKKQRIRLRDSAVLIGVCDIHNQINLKPEDNEEISQENLDVLTCKKYGNLLQENEIFCQIEPNSFQKYEFQEKRLLKKGLNKSLKANEERAQQIDETFFGNEKSKVELIKGKVLLTKNPCGHEGDIRLATAIDQNHPAYEKLKHLVNVIVFPIVGDRPLQNQMSGGDLDGDVYMIIWDKDIVDQATKNEIPPPSQDDQQIIQINTEDIGEKDGFDFSKTICGYFKRDMLGFLSNLHLKLALQKSLKHEDTQLAGLLCQVQVDFAKHGKCVKIESITELKSKVKGVPKFLADEKEEYENLNVIECNHVIQKLYDQVDIKGMFEDCLKKEHEYSILYKYQFSKFIVEFNTDSQIKYFLDKKYSQYLKDLYSKIVFPMECELKKNLLIRYKILNEGELFCSDFKYRFSDDKQNDYIGALGKSDEDLVRDVSQQIEEIIKKYRREFQKYCEQLSVKEYQYYYQSQQKRQQMEADQINQENKKKIEILEKPQFEEQIIKVNQAKCLYIACYFHLQNESSQTLIKNIENYVQTNNDQKYKKQLKDLKFFAKEKYTKEAEWISEHIQEFKYSSTALLNEKYNSDNDETVSSLIDDLNQNDAQFLQIIRDDLKCFKKYKQICKKAECDNIDKINFLWSFKKILSIPWIVAYDYILI